MFEFIKRYCRKKLLKEAKAEKRLSFLNLGEIRSLAFVYEIASVADVGELVNICNFIKERRFEFKGLVFVTKKGVFPKTGTGGVEKFRAILPENLMKESLFVVMPEQINWYGAFDMAAAEGFFKQKYDLMVSFNKHNNFTLRYAEMNVKAKMSVGMERVDGNYTMVLEGRGNSLPGRVEFINQVFYYLSVINAKSGDRFNEK